MAAKIGIKLADGTFFPIMDDDSSASETLELTTVRDNQRSVQINLFKKEDDASDPLYIGSLIVEDIQEKAAGDPTIELQLALDEDKNLSAEAVDKDSGSHQALKVSLETFADQAFNDLDFDLSSETADADIDLSASNTNIDDDFGTQHEFSASTFYTDEDEEESRTRRGIPVWLLVILILLGIAALVLGILLLTKKNLAEEDHPMAIQPDTAAVIPSEKPPMQESAVSQAAPSLPAEKPVTEPPAPQPAESAPIEQPAPQQPVQTEQPAKQEPPVQQTKPAVKEPAASVAAQKAIRYKLRWGDTLWDLSETYYRNPWLYTEIAKHNKLKNPDLIISGTYIEIPPQ